MAITIREWTDDDTEALVDSVSCWQVGDYIEPLVQMASGALGRRALKVTERIEEPNPPFGTYVGYKAVDRFGKVYDVMRMDHPRGTDEADFNGEAEDIDDGEEVSDV